MVSHSLVQDQPDEATLSMRNRPDGLIVSQARDRAEIHRAGLWRVNGTAVSVRIGFLGDTDDLAMASRINLVKLRIRRRQLDLAPSHEALIAIARRYSRFRSRLPFGARYVSRLACSRRSLIGFFVALRMHLRSGPGPFRPGIHSHAC